MRRNLPFFLYLLALSALSGWLMSHMSWIGRVGINLFHKEYKFLKLWYQGGGVVLGILLLLFLLQWLADRRLKPATARLVQVVAVLLAIGGVWVTYQDFRTDFTHNVLKERFHLGAYLFWVGWISISLFLLATRRYQKPASEVEVERR
jgi:hypothetical protein